MPELPIGGAPFFERGIESITFRESDAGLGMPRQLDLAPAEQAQRPLLEQLLAAPNLDASLDTAIRPLIQDRDLLKPTKFRETLEGVRDLLQSKAGELEKEDPKGAKALLRASRLLDEELRLRETLQMYRSVLYQG